MKATGFIKLFNDLIVGFHLLYTIWQETVYEMQIEKVLLFDLDVFLKNFVQDITNGKFPATTRSHGQVGFHAPGMLGSFILLFV